MSTMQLTVENLSKKYRIGKTKGGKEAFVSALENASFSLTTGLYGLLGPNGAGKSTLMNILVGNLKQNTGRVLFNGEDIRRLGKNYRAILGYMPQQQNLYPSYTGMRFLQYMAALKDIPPANVMPEIERTIKIVNLSDQLHKKIAAYSGGMKQRLLVAASLLGSPKVLIMDEPTAGFDPKERVRLRNSLAEIAKDSIVVVATHVVSDVESVAKEIILLKKGVIVGNDSASSLIELYAPSENLEEVYLSVFGEEDENDSV